MFLNQKIREARLEKKMTQKQLADEISNLGKKVRNTAISNWEAGLYNPDIDTLVLICQILEKDGNYFFSNSKEYVNIEGLNTEDIIELNKFADYLRSKKINK